MTVTVAEIFERLPGAFNAEAAGDTQAVIAFKLSGEEAGDWVVEIADGAASVREGAAEMATLTLSADSRDFVDLITGRMDPTRAFIQGKVQLDGHLGLALKLAELFQVDEG